MKKFYFEVTIAGNSITTNSLSKALEMVRQDIAKKSGHRNKAFRYITNKKSFQGVQDTPIVTGESVEEIPEKEYEILKKKETAPVWLPKIKTSEQALKKTAGMISPQMEALTSLPKLVNDSNEKIQQVKCRVEIAINSINEVGVFVKRKEQWTILARFSRSRDSVYFGLIPKNVTEQAFWTTAIQDTIEVIRERASQICDCEISNVEIVLSDLVKQRIQKIVDYQEYLAESGKLQRHSAPNPSIEAINFNGDGETVRQALDLHLDKFVPYDKIHETDVPVETSNKRLAERGIFSLLDGKDSAQTIVDAIERIDMIEGCVSSREVSPLISKQKILFGARILGECGPSGEISILQVKKDKLEEMVSTAKKTGQHSTGKIIGTFIHEDTHAMLNFVMDKLGERTVEDEFAELVTELRSYPEEKRGEILSTYGATTSKTNSKCQEMVAESRAEVISEGGEARPFSRRVYIVLMKLYKKALAMEK